MPFPDLAMRTDGVLWAEATGVPDDGDNTFLLPFVDSGLPPNNLDEDWLIIIPQKLGPSVVSTNLPVGPLLSLDKRFMTLNFVQAGADSLTLTVFMVHTLVR